MRPFFLCALLLLLSSCGRGGPGHSKSPGGAMTHTNHLIHEKSPYLQQHAHNPVDWYPWGPEALGRARKENRPIFLSIGYSTCHWCHVMEHESFENDTIAAYLNAHYIAIKVDREERPDLDNLYMAAVQGMTGSGGWPMSVFLTPELKPFYAGTYFPPDDRYGRPGFGRLLKSLNDAFTNRRAEVDSSAEGVTEFLRAQADSHAGAAPRMPGIDVLETAVAQLDSSFDALQGGFGTAPKFPTPHHLMFLLHYHARTGSVKALHMATLTLQQMYRGGIHDHLGGGFHRYSTDGEWLAPHFEKMLYDQAGLLESYVAAWKVTRDPEFAEAARDISDYVLRDLRHAEGGFLSAEDADSEGEEGRFYVWSPGEVKTALGVDAERFAKIYDVSAGGNWEGKNILRLKKSVHEWARELGVGESALRSELARDRAKLLALRSSRVRPHLDDKVLSGWNGLMISAMAQAGAALDEPRYTEAARKAADFALAHMERSGRLLRRWHSGSADIPAYLEDYAFFARGLLDLYEVTRDTRYLAESLRLAREMDRIFKDPAGGYRFSGEGNEELLAPTRDVYDGATPSGNSVAAGLLLRLGHLTADRQLEDKGRSVLTTFGGTVSQSPQAYTEMLRGADFAAGPTAEIVLAGRQDDPELQAMERELQHRFLPRAVSALNPVGAGEAQTVALVPYLKDQGALGGKATAYVCRGYACRLPVHTASELARELDGLSAASAEVRK